jgi:hypothetical protein
MRAFLFAMSLLIASQAVAAEPLDDLREPLSDIHARVTGLLSSLDSLLIKAVRDTQRVDAPLLIRHATVVSSIRGLDAVRAVLVADSTGDLILDTYNWPTPPINLNNRTYIKQAQANPGVIFVGELVADARSGVPFVPIARGYDGSTAVAVINEGAFWRGQLCGRCYGFITTGGRIASTQPQGIKGYDELAKRLSIGGEGITAANKRNFSFISKRIDSSDLAVILLYDH